MNWFDKIKLALKLKEVAEVVKQDNDAGFDWKVAGLKFLKNLMWTSLGLLALHFSNPTNIAAILNVLPDNLQKVLAPFVISGAIAIKNWYDHRNDVVQMVVPAAAVYSTPVPIVVKPPELTPVNPGKDAGV